MLMAQGGKCVELRKLQAQVRLRTLPLLRTTPSNTRDICDCSRRMPLGKIYCAVSTISRVAYTNVNLGWFWIGVVSKCDGIGVGGLPDGAIHKGGLSFERYHPLMAITDERRFGENFQDTTQWTGS